MKVTEIKPAKPDVSVELSNHETLLLHNLLGLIYSGSMSHEGREFRDSLCAKLKPFLTT